MSDVSSSVEAESDRLSEYPGKVQQTEAKITVRFRPMSATPHLQTNTFKVASSHPFSALVAFLRRQLRFKPTDSLFCYVNSAFAPPLDANLSDLAKAYANEGVLNIYYCATVAFG